MPPLGRVIAPFLVDAPRNRSVLDASTLDATRVRILSPGDRGVAKGALILAPGLERLAAADAAAVLTHWHDQGAVATLVRRPDDAAFWDVVDRQGGSLFVPALEVAPSTRWEDLYVQLDEAIRAATYPDMTGADSSATTDLYAIAEILSLTSGGPVVVWDRDWRLLAYSETRGTVDDVRRRSIMERRAPSDVIEQFRAEGILTRLWNGDLVRVERPGMSTRLATCVHAAGELLGSVWIHEGDEPLDTEVGDALRRAADLAGLHILRRRAQRDQSAAERRDAISSFLTRGDITSPEVRLFASTLTPPFRVLSVRPAPDDPKLTLQLVRRMADTAATYIEAYRLRALETVVDDVVHVLFTDSDDDATIRSATKLFDQLRAEGPHVPVHAATGVTAHAVGAITRAVGTSTLALDTLAFVGASSRLVAYQAVRSTVLLMRLREAAESDWALLEGPIADLARGQEGERELLSTLLALFDASGVVKDAAAALRVHPNTVRYRLRRLEAEHGIDLHEPLSRFAVEAQVRIICAESDTAH